MNSRYERVLDQAIAAAERSSLEEVPLGDSHQHAFLKGKRIGLMEALEEYRKQKRTNQDPDDDL
jgi:hypothetical protein